MRTNILARVARLRLLTAAALLGAAPAQDPSLRVSLVLPSGGATFDGRGALAVQVDVLHPADLDDAAPTKPLALGYTDRAWPEALRLDVLGPDGKPVAWPLQRSGPQRQEPLSLTPGAPASAGFALPPDDARQLPPGTYTLRATLQVEGGTLWRGKVESAPFLLEVRGAAVEAGPLQLRLLGEGALAPGDPWVFALIVPPPLRGVTEAQLRGSLGADGHRGEPYRLQLRGPDGQDVAVPFAPLATPPTLPETRELDAYGFGPVLAALGAPTTAPLAPGTYRLSAQWQSAADAKPRSGELTFTIATPEAARAHPARQTKHLQALLGCAQASLWHGQWGNSAHVERSAGAAAQVLLEAERVARDQFAANPTTESALGFAEVCRLQESYDDARAFAQVALDLWTPPADARDAAQTPIPEQLRELPHVLAEASQYASRLSPYLRTALARQAGPAPTEPKDTAKPGDTAKLGDTAKPPAPTPPLEGDVQWATAARASSEYRATEYAAAQATGAPDVLAHGDSTRAWTPKTKDGGEEWLELTYAQPVHATAVRVVQTYHPGAIQRIEVVDAQGRASVVWTGPDATAYARSQIGVLTATFPRTEQKVAVVKVWLDTKPQGAWREIDAVALVGTAK